MDAGSSKSNIRRSKRPWMRPCITITNNKARKNSMKGKEKGNDSIMNYIKKAVIITLFTTLAVMIRPCTAKAETVKGAFTITEGDSNCSYDSNLLTITGDCTVKNTTQGTTSDHIKIDITNDCTVTLAGVNIESSSAAPILINIANDKTLTLKLSEKNTVKATGDNYAGIEKDGDNSGSLIITGEDNGELKATGGTKGAGIGGGKDESGSNITIIRGTVKATGGSGSGAGIGGGYQKSGSNITISGGNVTATGGKYGAGIGGGHKGIGSNIKISGGNVTAIGGVDGAGIGGGILGSGNNIKISGGKVIAKSTGQTYHGSAIGKGYNGVDQSGNSITPSSTNPVNIWQNTENESDTKTYSDYTSSLDISSWTNQILMIIFDKIDVVSSNSSSSCNHHYEWEVEREPTETQEGELVYKCSLCGDITAREPISSYEYYLYKCMGKIRDAKAGDTVTFSSKCWNSYPKAFFEKLAERRDITVKIQFTYEHKDYEITIAPGQTVDTSSDYYGPLKLMELYGASD